ncbi:MAG TPA: sugar ABC transporter permease [Candidatus Binatia bacterium]|nr:sugar ABC transporter permease [Candidatus Binatia bacterium]
MLTRAQRREVEGWALMLPVLAVMAVVTLYPLMRTVWLSFTDAELPVGETVPQWVGIENYNYVITDPDFLDALLRTLHFTLASVAVELVLGILVGLLLNQPFRGRALVRSIVILPWALPTIVNGMLWRLSFNPDYGAVNAMLTQLHIIDQYRSWLGDPDIVMDMVILADVWKNYAIVALVVLAALQTIPSDLYEAMRIDGAGAWSRFWNLTVPGILGPLTVVMVLRLIDCFRVFDIIYVMTRGGPADATKTLSFFVYQESFAFLRAGSGASYAVICAIMSAILIAIYISLLKRQETLS